MSGFEQVSALVDAAGPTIELLSQRRNSQGVAENGTGIEGIMTYVLAALAVIGGGGFLIKGALAGYGKNSDKKEAFSNYFVGVILMVLFGSVSVVVGFMTGVFGSAVG